jgi:hypothetical protein
MRTLAQVEGTRHGSRINTKEGKDGAWLQGYQQQMVAGSRQQIAFRVPNHIYHVA